MPSAAQDPYNSFRRPVAELTEVRERMPANLPNVRPSATAQDLNVWPANLPAGARWLPYPELSREATTYVAPIYAPPAPALQWRLPIGYWRWLGLAVIGAGLIGIFGGMAFGLLVGAR